MQEGDVLEELSVLGPPLELVLRQEVVVAAVDLAGPARASRCRHCELEIGAPLEEPLDERAFPGAGGAGDDEELLPRAQRRRRPTSSARWRSESPPTVLDWLIRHWLRKRAAFTRPNFGTAMSMSKTFAVST